MGWALRAATAAVVAVAGVGLPAGAQEEAAPPAGLLRLASISPWTDAERPLRVIAQVTNVTDVQLEQVELRVSVHARVLSRSQLRSSIDEGPETVLLGTTTQAVGPVLPGRTATVEVRRPMAEISLAISRTGVYPVTITLAHADGEAVMRTAVPFLASSPEEPLNVAWVLHATRPTVVTPDGAFTELGLDTLALSELGQQLAQIADRPGTAITLAMNPTLLATLAELSDGYTLARGTEREPVGAETAAARAAAEALDVARRAAASAGELATVPFTPADLPTLSSIGPEADVLRQVTLGRSLTETVVGRVPSAGVLAPPAGRLDAASLDLLEPAGVTTAVLDPAVVEQPTEPFQPQLFGPSRPVAVGSAADQPLTGLLADAPLRARMEGDERGVLLAQAMIAETASAWLELPLFAGDRLLTVSSPSLPSPPAIAAALNALRSAPWVRLVTATQASARLRPQGDTIGFTRVPPQPSTHLRAARAARRAYRTLQEITGDLPDRLDRLDRSILLAQSSEWALQPGRGTTYADAVVDEVEQAFDRIEVGERRQVTLTSRTGEIPITVVNNNDFPVRVRIRLAGPKVAFPKGDSRNRELLGGRPDTLGFEVEALANGSFPVDVRIETPDGGRVIARSRLILRSTAVSTVTLALVGGSAIFLIIASTRRAIRRRAQARNGAAA